MIENAQQVKKSFIRRFWWAWIFLTILVLIVGFFGVTQIVPSKPPEDFLITHNMFDLKQVISISQFRSCNGHRSMSQYTTEPDSSMVHYIMTNVKESKNRGHEVKVYAPFDGYITDSLNNQGFSFVPKSSKAPWWPFNQYRINVAHVRAYPQFQGTKPVKAGDLVGYENPDEFYEDAATISLDVRIGVLALPPQWVANNGEPLKNMSSMFHYMSDKVFAEYKATTPSIIVPEDFIIPVSYRAAHPCKFRDGGPYFDNKPEENFNSKYRGNIFLWIDNNNISAINNVYCLISNSEKKCDTNRSTNFNYGSN